LAAISFGVMALALPGEALACKGHKGDKFAKADANNDGFLTAAEVGDKRWARIQVADANSDGQISKAEFDQAKKDGKIGKRKKKGKAEA
jgi:hypothetical protein